MSRKFTRRRFLQAGSAAAVLGAGAPSQLRGLGSHSPSPVRASSPGIVTLADETSVKLLAMRAIDAARSAGASYADVRLTRIITERFQAGAGTFALMGLGPTNGAPEDYERLGVGVRAFIDGCWGFAASARWTMEEMPVLAAQAVRQARANAKASPRRIELAPATAVTGSWAPPGVIDPFLVPPEEKIDFLRDVADGPVRKLALRRQVDQWGGAWDITFTRLEWALATTDGTYCTQRRYTSDGKLTALYNSIAPNRSSFGMYETDYPGLVAHGWEYCSDVALARTRFETVIDKHYHPDPEISRIPVDVGRYDVVCSAPVACQLLQQTIGEATELDRALGYEANAGGTSFLNDPLSMIGTLQVGSPLVTVTADRSTPGHLATVQWDDEGVVPSTFDIIKAGVMNEFQTTRETASYLAPYYAKRGTPVRSLGCAGAESALSITMSHVPNLTLRPNSADLSFDDLVRDTKRGIAFVTAGIGSADFQNKTGVVGGPGAQVREIVNGKLGRMITGAQLLYESTKLWKSAIALGGAASAHSHAAFSEKGQPSQTTAYTVTAVPVKFKDASIADATRRA